MPPPLERVLTVGRIHGNFSEKRIRPTVESFGQHATQFGPVLIVSNHNYPHRDALTETALSNGKPLMVDIYKGQGNNHGGMLNIGVEAVQEHRLPYFATVSNDLVSFVPSVFPQMIARLDADPELTTVAVAVQGVHDMDLLAAVNNGETRVTPYNYAKTFANHAFSMHRALPVSQGRLLPPEARRFLQHERSEGELLGRHEDIEIALRLLKEGYPLKTLVLAGNAAIIRDSRQEVASAPDKNATRQQTADFYQKYHGITDAELQKYLDSHFAVEFVSK